MESTWRLVEEYRTFRGLLQHKRPAWFHHETVWLTLRGEDRTLKVSCPSSMADHIREGVSYRVGHVNSQLVEIHPCPV